MEDYILLIATILFLMSLSLNLINILMYNKSHGKCMLLYDDLLKRKKYTDKLIKRLKAAIKECKEIKEE